MGFLDRLLGREPDRSAPQPYGQQPYGQQPSGGQPYGQQPYGQQPSGGQGAAQASPRSEDEIAVERYRYLLRTAPPETLEQVHAEAFSRLTPDQRRRVFEELGRAAPAGEAPRGDDPASLAQAATRSELRQPGSLERTLGPGGGGRGPGMGSVIGGSLLGTVAGFVIGNALVSSFLPPVGAEGDPGADGGDPGAEAGDQGADGGGADDPSLAGAEGQADAGGWGDGGGDGWGGGFGDGGGFDADLGGFDI